MLWYLIEISKKKKIEMYMSGVWKIIRAYKIDRPFFFYILSHFISLGNIDVGRYRTLYSGNFTMVHSTGINLQRFRFDFAQRLYTW